MKNSKAFTIPEFILGVLVVATFFGVVLYGFVHLQRAMLPASAIVNDRVVAIAPSYAPFASALEVQRVLSDRVGEGSAVYVLGGAHPGLPSTAVAAAQRPLSFSSLPIGAIGATPLDARSFYLANSSTLGSVATAAHAEDFTIVVIGSNAGALAVTCAVQVTRSDLLLDIGDGESSFVLRTVRLWDISGADLGYSFLERAGQGVFVGATHTWLRYAEGLSIYEEGPATVVLPDPWVYAGSRGRADDIPPFSRFIYSLPVSR